MSDGLRSIIANNIYRRFDDYAEIIVEYFPAFGEWGRSLLEMWINGVKWIDGFNNAPKGSGSTYIAWGCFGGTTIGRGAWHEVILETLPRVQKSSIRSIEPGSDNTCFEVAKVWRGVYSWIKQPSARSTDLLCASGR